MRRPPRRQAPPLDLLAILRALLQHGVRFVVIGGIAGRMQGSATLTEDLDVCYERSNENFGALGAALRELDARLRGAPARLPFRLDARTLKAGLNFTFETRYGDLDCLGEASGGFTYGILEPNADKMDVDGIVVLVAALDDLIRMKRAAGRAQDLIEVHNLSALREVREKEGRG